ncbi:hypothetical protein SLNWT_0225 [Streptomyces albus]|uniref:DUF4874 domain-containing protein n=1 Tax=Streptomyces albus (strain ATCC 21838 / DSM 41398 / FERM P-419 / JCM 4703 / NBRC 107858) TaxID=1081613 RepID=A0A0B5EP64_STRA4|nr:hypothetical protein SLNWT_0225 [Streptomyces albus]AOU74914.1 hypothetical protein SLNHY_0223 [Streptomyces albus]AYN30725.1 hypothetical protein DUI70_0221 [Streptomyces albus]
MPEQGHPAPPPTGTGLGRRGLLAAAGGAAALPLTGPAGARAAAATAPRTTVVRHRGIRPDDPRGREPVHNPLRGFRYEMSYNAADLSSPWPDEQDHSPDAAATLELLEREYGGGARLVQLYFYLWEFATGEIPADALAHVEKVFAGLRRKGYAAVLRFVYDDGVREPRRYTVRDIQRHIGQLGPLVERNRDVVAVWQAGFLGAWGEWHGSHYRHETYPEAVTAIMTSLVAALPAGMHTQVRYAEKHQLIRNPAILDRVGFHNDYLTLGQGEFDYYVPGDPHWRTYLEVTADRMTDGEMPWDKGQSEDPYAWSTVIPGLDTARRLQTLRFDSLSLVHNATVTIPAWRATPLSEAEARRALLPVSDGYFRDRRGAAVPRTQFEYLRDHLGYRVEVREVRWAPAGRGRIRAEVDLVNRGFAPPKHPRPVRLVLLGADGEVLAEADTGADWRQWLPQGRAESTEDHGEPRTCTVRAVLALPRRARGGCRLGLALPDPHTAGAAHAVRCANATVGWVDGVNVLAEVRPG